MLTKTAEVASVMNWQGLGSLAMWKYLLVTCYTGIVKGLRTFGRGFFFSGVFSFFLIFMFPLSGKVGSYV